MSRVPKVPGVPQVPWVLVLGVQMVLQVPGVLAPTYPLPRPPKPLRNLPPDGTH